MRSIHRSPCPSSLPIGLALTFCLGLCMAVAGFAMPPAAAFDPWTELGLDEVAHKAAPLASGHRAFALDMPRLKSHLLAAGMEGDPAPAETTDGKEATDDPGVDVESWPVVELPLPDGTKMRFAVERSRVMAEALRQRYPELETFRGLAVDRPLVEARFELTHHGFHGMILGLGETVFINPMVELPGQSKAEPDWYVAFSRRHTVEDARRPAFRCDTQSLMATLSQRGGGQGSGRPGYGVSSAVDASEDVAPRLGDKMVTGGVLRTYRTAIAATGEYTQFHGGSVALGLSAVVTATNRLNGVLRRELSLRLELVGSNDQLIYTNAGLDPYTNSNTFQMLEENQNNLDSVLGAGGYDLGHVFATGGGGVAALGATCFNGAKGLAVSSLPVPVGDPFVVDYVAHEVGHQLGANHIFNASTAVCGPNREPSAAYEPGSGSTIMSYSGICGAENLQTFSDDYYNTHSFDEMAAHVHQGAGRCGTTRGGAGVPSVQAGPNYTIPRRTPFTLAGSGNASTYAWEQHDLGPPGPPNTDNGRRPIFRSFSPVASPRRTLPRLSNLLQGVERLGESLPTTSRDLTFRLTGRNNQGGVAHDEMVVRVAGGLGPFQVLEPTGQSVWTANEEAIVEWDVAGTDQAPVSCQLVDILFSSQGGNDNFPIILAQGVPNSGLYAVTVPDALGASGRVKVACSNNIFFAVSEGGNLTVRGESSCTPDAATLCLGEGRFKVTIDWRDFADQVGVGQLVENGTSADSGLFYFFDANNWEMLVKVINGCAFNGNYWVFAAATTNVEYTLRVADTQTGDIFTFTNPLGEPSAALTDTAAFATCP